MQIFNRADILLPRQACPEKWAVIACDQFTSDGAYWQRVRQQVGQAPSTLHMILPEAELGAPDEEQKISAINAAMAAYVDGNVFQTFENCYIYVERRLLNGSVRPGLIGAVDLQAYDYRPGSVSPIRATEQTVLERIPPRQRVRQDAVLEFPHVLMLCDDVQKTLIEPITACRDTLPKLYDFDLMEGGGHITGWLVSGETAQAFDERFARFAASVPEKYADLSGAPVVLAVGDGNHSLATAKSCYEQLLQQQPETAQGPCPARYALVELENIHDEAQLFEPIHRIVTHVQPERLLRDVQKLCAPGGYPVTVLLPDGQKELLLDRSRGEMAVAVLQQFLDGWLAENGGSIDYIHGEAELRQLARQQDAVGFLLPPMEKHSLFRGVIAGGVLPRKTFSMGHAREKRYYLEGRKIR